MSNFWDSVIGTNNIEPVVEAVVEPVSTNSFWASIGLGVESKPVEQSKVKAVKSTAKKSKAVVQAEIVYETVEGLVVPVDDCKHHWMIPSGSAWAIGVCKLCNGERWFSNRLAEESIFNDTIISPTGPKDNTRALDTGTELYNSLANKVIAEEGI